MHATVSTLRLVTATVSKTGSNRPRHRGLRSGWVGDITNNEVSDVRRRAGGGQR